MDLDLYSLICNDISNRVVWANRQAVWYQMRKDGIRRRNKPWPSAMDIHYPLCDTVIEKMKPFYINQLFATERLADFVAKSPQYGDEVTEAAWWFDYKLKHKSNLEDEVILAIDAMLVYGRGILKVTWCPEEKGKAYNQGGYVDFDAIEPLYLIVPQEACDLKDSDRIVHVKHVTPFDYKHGKDSEKYNQDKDFVKRITGTREEDAQMGVKQQIKQISEGITHTKSDIIILWETFEKTSDGWTVHTCSPSVPSEDVREPFKMPYKHGKAPFVEFTMERAEKGYYSQRGVCEILYPFEQSMCKMWNEKHDAMTLYNRPVFSSDRDMPNTGNITLRPGQILPFAIRAIQTGAPPISWDQEMQNTRIVAEQRIAVPDFGLGDREFDNSSEKATATEIQATMSQQNQIVNMRSRVFRKQLGELWCQSWDLLKQYDKDLSYLNGSKAYELKSESRDLVMSVQPNGSSDSWNMHASLQKAVNLFVMLKGSPHIKPGELEKIIIEKTEAGLVERLYQDPKITEGLEAEKQMMEIPALEDGFPITAKPDDRHDIHASVLSQYLLKQVTSKAPVKPEGKAMTQQHFGEHLQAWMQADKKGATNFLKQFQMMMGQALGLLQPGEQPKKSIAA